MPRRNSASRGHRNSILYGHSPSPRGLLEEEEGGGADDSVAKAFRDFDLDGSGLIEVDEIVDCLDEKFGIVITLKEATAMMAVFDDSGDGGLDLEEFREMVKGLGDDLTVTAVGAHWAEVYAQKAGSDATISAAMFSDHETEHRYWAQVRQELALVVLRVINEIKSNVGDDPQRCGLVLQRISSGRDTSP